MSFKFDDLIVRGVLLFFRLDVGQLSWFYGKVLGENSVYIKKESGRKFRDLLGPPEEGNMLGGRRFKARQSSELVFLTDK